MKDKKGGPWKRKEKPKTLKIKFFGKSSRKSRMKKSEQPFLSGTIGAIGPIGGTGITGITGAIGAIISLFLVRLL